jgi:hypothetical protein
VKRVVADPAEIFARGFPAEIREEILAEARDHMAPLATALARLSFSELPFDLQTSENERAMAEAAKEIVKLSVKRADLEGTIQILRAWIVKLEIDDGATYGTTKITIAYKKAS